MRVGPAEPADARYDEVRLLRWTPTTTLLPLLPSRADRSDSGCRHNRGAPVAAAAFLRCLPCMTRLPRTRRACCCLCPHALPALTAAAAAPALNMPAPAPPADAAKYTLPTCPPGRYDTLPMTSRCTPPCGPPAWSGLSPRLMQPPGGWLNRKGTTNCAPL